MQERVRGRPFVSPNMGLCARCRVCTCQWAYGKPVPGWQAEPSALYPGGWRVLACPAFLPMERRQRNAAAAGRRR